MNRSVAMDGDAVALDWPAFLQRNDMVWKELPRQWENAPFIGNGNLGTMFLLGDNGALHLLVNRGDLYDHRHVSRKLPTPFDDQDQTGYPPMGLTLYNQYRLPNGGGDLKMGAAPLKGKMRLDLWNAELRGTLFAGTAEWELRRFVDASSNVIVLELVNKAATEATPPTLTWLPGAQRQAGAVGRQQRRNTPGGHFRDSIGMCSSGFPQPA